MVTDITPGRRIKNPKVSLDYIVRDTISKKGGQIEPPTKEHPDYRVLPQNARTGTWACCCP